MRRTRLVLGGISLVLALLLAGVWLVPTMLDWNRYREAIAALASQQLGRPVHIGGGVSLQLLPQPILTADDVIVAGLSDAYGQPLDTDTIGLQAKALRLRVALGPLLAGKVDARELTLQGADLRLPWPPPAGALAQRPPAWLTGLQARIEDGRVQIGTLVFTGVEGTLTTDPDTGTLSTAVVLQAGASRWQVTARLARPGRDGSAGIDMSLDGLDKLRDTGASFSGQIGADGALSGRVAGRGPDLSQLMPAPAQNWRADGRLNAAAGLAVADELALEIGGIPARGAIALRVQPQARLDVAIAAGRLDLDAWLPALLARDAAPLRPGIPTGIDLSAEAATLAGGTLRRLRGGLDLRDGGLVLRDVSAVLPGEAPLTLAGQMATDPNPQFDGDVTLHAPDLHATLAWLQRAVPALRFPVPDAALRTADLVAHLVADPGQMTATNLRGTVDDAKLTGTVAAKAGVRPAITAALTLDRLSVERWLPNPPDLVDAAPGALTRLRGMDTDLKLQLAAATWNGFALGPVAVELQSEAARVILRRLDAQPLGTHLSLSGQLNDAARLSDGRLDVSAADLATIRPLLATLPFEPDLPALLRGPGSLLVLAAGPPDALAARVTLEIGDLRLEAQPLANLPARRWNGPLTIHHPGAPRLLELLRLGGTAAWLGDGSLSLVGQVAVAPGRIELETGMLAAGALRGSGRLVAEGRRIFGQLALETLPLPLVYPRSPDPLPIAWLRPFQAALHVEAAQVLAGLSPVLQSAAGDVTLQDGVLRVARGTAKLAGGTVAGALTLDAGANPPAVSVQATASGLQITGPLFETPLDLVSGQVDATLDLAASGYSPAALLATTTGRASFHLRDGAVTGFDLVAAASALGQTDPTAATTLARQALLAGSTPFTTLDAPLIVARGLVTTEATLASPAGTAALSGSLDLQAGTIDLRLSMAAKPAEGTPNLPSIGERILGQPATPTRTPELTALLRFLADRTQ